jgi:hypothetical protein
MKHVQCGICLDYYLEDRHCHSCGAICIDGKHYNFHSGREMARAIPRPVFRLVYDALQKVEGEAA